MIFIEPGFNKLDSDGKPEEIFYLFEQTFVTKLSLQEYTNIWKNFKLT